MKYLLRIAVLVLAPMTWPVSAQQNQTSPCATEQHQQFDFWVGEWRVTNMSDGQHVGDNTLTKIQNDCILLEDWRSASSPFTGTSFNFYNSTTQQWEQIWLDNQGGNLHMLGNRDGNQMVLKSDTFSDSEGRETYNRITWTINDDGSVRQQWLRVIDGADDQVVFDGLYKKAE